MKSKFGLLLMVLFCSVATFGQQLSDLRINELLIKNDSNMVDEYGCRVPWVEIYNTAYNSVNLAGCFLTDDTTGLADGTGRSHWYRIPTTDNKTLLQQRSSIVFFLDGDQYKGTFHANFNPQNSKNHYIALINSNGKTLIDLMEYPATLKEAEQSFGCYTDGVLETDKQAKKVKKSGRGMLDHITPGSVNLVDPGATKQEKLKESDPYGIGLAIISISVVFAALILIYIILKIFGAINRRSEEKAKAIAEKPAAPKSAGNGKISDETVAAITAALIADQGCNADDEVIAAITMALHLDLDSCHDEESEILTFTPSYQYSAWAQKNLVMKNVQRRK